jgi:hypothetical protein
LNKAVLIAVFTVLFVASLSGCNGSLKQAADNTQEIDNLKSEIEFLTSLVAELSMQDEYNTVAQNNGIYPMFSEQYEADHTDLYILLEETNLHYTPSLDSGVVSPTSWKGAVVKVFARVIVYENSESEHWILARKANFAESVNNIGWILVTEHVNPLTEELSVLATDHIRILDDCVDEFTGKLMSEVFPHFKEIYFGIGGHDDHMVELFTTGGVGFKVNRDFIVYPMPD